jgi:hypothetical protein
VAIAFTLLILNAGSPAAHDGVTRVSALAEGEPKSPRIPAAEPAVNNFTASLRASCGGVTFFFMFCSIYIIITVIPSEARNLLLMGSIYCTVFPGEARNPLL